MIRIVPSDPKFEGGCNACKSVFATKQLEVGLDKQEGASQYVTGLRFCDSCLLSLGEVVAGAVGVGRRRGR